MTHEGRGGNGKRRGCRKGGVPGGTSARAGSCNAALRNATTPTEVGTVYGGGWPLLGRQVHFFAADFFGAAAAFFFAILLGESERGVEKVAESGRGWGEGPQGEKKFRRRNGSVARADWSRERIGHTALHVQTMLFPCCGLGCGFDPHYREIEPTTPTTTLTGRVCEGSATFSTNARHGRKMRGCGDAGLQKRWGAGGTSAQAGSCNAALRNATTPAEAGTVMEGVGLGRFGVAKFTSSPPAWPPPPSSSSPFCGGSRKWAWRR